jgi:hypothetical protein
LTRGLVLIRLLLLFDVVVELLPHFRLIRTNGQRETRHNNKSTINGFVYHCAKRSMNLSLILSLIAN